MDDKSLSVSMCGLLGDFCGAAFHFPAVLTIQVPGLVSLIGFESAAMEQPGLCGMCEDASREQKSRSQRQGQRREGGKAGSISWHIIKFQLLAWK